MDFTRFNLSAIPPASHGAIDYQVLQRAGLSPDDVLDFSVNSNPFGPSPLVIKAVSKTPLDRYPDRECLALRRVLADRFGVSGGQLVFGNGTAELIWLAAFAFFKQGDEVLILGPTFGEYERSVRLMAALPIKCDARPETGFAHEIAAVSQLLASKKYRAVFICNPNNPTGQILAPETIYTWAENNPDTLFLIDEAYLSFVTELKSLAHSMLANILVFRSMTKDYALAGLRLGYAIGDEHLIRELAAVRPAWNVNSLAQAAGLAALTDEKYYLATLSQLREEKQFFWDRFVSLNFSPVPSHTHFFLLPVKSASGFRQDLLSQAILVRDCTSFGLPKHIRISTRTRSQNQKLLDCLRTLDYQKTMPE